MVSGDPLSDSPGFYRHYDRFIGQAHEELHAGGLRISIEWSRTFPTSTEGVSGYDNLKKLSTRAFTHGKYYFPRVDRDLLKQHSDGIIALTACLGGEVGRKAMKDDRAKCIEAGANDYCSKPVDMEKLTALMRVWLHKT